MLLLRTLAAQAALLVSASADAPRAVVWMLGDDYGYAGVGFAHGPNPGNPEMRTPHLDALAAEGVVLDRHIVYKYCSPTRAALMVYAPNSVSCIGLSPKPWCLEQSGRIPAHVNQNNECNDIESTSGIDLRYELLPAKLKRANFTTAFVGKWHGGARSLANLPINRGFGDHFGFLKGGEVSPRFSVPQYAAPPAHCCCCCCCCCGGAGPLDPGEWQLPRRGQEHRRSVGWPRAFQPLGHVQRQAVFSAGGGDRQCGGGSRGAAVFVFSLAQHALSDPVPTRVDVRIDGSVQQQ
jgi:hypothetical protein